MNHIRRFKSIQFGSSTRDQKFSVILTKSPLYRVKNLSPGYTVSGVSGQKSLVPGSLVLELNCTCVGATLRNRLSETVKTTGDVIII